MNTTLKFDRVVLTKELNEKFKQVGEVFEGKVTGVTKFGAFVAMPDGKNGLVHISEIANTYVNDINEFVKEGQVVKVRVIGIGDGGKVHFLVPFNKKFRVAFKLSILFFRKRLRVLGYVIFKNFRYQFLKAPHF